MKSIRLFCQWGLIFLFLCFSAAVQAMPPHPSLEAKIPRGEVILPNALAEVVLHGPWGPNQPEGAPSSLIGTLRVLAVVVDFSDKVHIAPATYFDNLIFASPVSGRGSVRDYFNKISYGQVDVVTVNLPSSLGWVRSSNNYSYYVNGNYGWGTYPNNCQKLAEDVVDAIASHVDFSKYDNTGSGYAGPIMIIHAGAGGELTGNKNDIWSHSWSLKNPRTYNGVIINKYVTMPEYLFTANSSTSDMTIGVFAHELGHGIWGLPDLYDTSYLSRGIGQWSLMAYGSWNGSSGDSPAWPDAWSRIKMGLVSPTIITGNAYGKSIPQAANNPAPAQTILKLTSSLLGPQEYFLVENRQQTANTYDEYLPGSGLLIWHVDEAQWNNNNPCTQATPCSCTTGQHYMVALEQADNLLELEKHIDVGDSGDSYPGSTNNRSWTWATLPGCGSWYTCQDTGIGIVSISDSNAVMTADIQSPMSSGMGFDLDGDGKTDILWQNKDNGKVYVWYMDGVNLTNGASIQNSGNFEWGGIVGTGDLNGDGKTDFLSYHMDKGDIYFWYMDGITNTGRQSIGSVAPNSGWRIVNTGDFNGDSKTDILWQHKGTGGVYVWYMNGTNQTGGAWILPSINTGWEIVGTGDYNSDGKTDILWQYKPTGGAYVWYMNGTNQTGGAWILSSINTSWEIVGTGDFNSDGKADILWQYKPTGGVYVWYMNGSNHTGGAWIASSIHTDWKIVAPK